MPASSVLILKRRWMKAVAQPARNAGGDRDQHRQHRSNAGHQQRRAQAAAERERAFAGQIGKAQQAERDHDAERDKAVEQALRQRHRHEIHEAVEEIGHHQRTSSSLSSADWKRLTSDSTVSPDLFRAAGLEHDRALVHHHQAISVVDRVMHVVRHHDGGDARMAHGLQASPSSPLRRYADRAPRNARRAPGFPASADMPWSATRPAAGRRKEDRRGYRAAVRALSPAAPAPRGTACGGPPSPPCADSGARPRL